MQPAKQPEPYVAGAAGDVIKPYLDPEGKVFVRDFYMTDRIGAQAGASVSDYEMATVLLGGPLGAIGQVADGRKPAHLFVVGPDDPSQPWNAVMTSPGTIGWNPRGAFYQYDPYLPAGANFYAWCQAGAPKSNDLGNWANNGLPLAYVQETWKHPLERDLYQPGFPLAGKPRYAGKK